MSSNELTSLPPEIGQLNNLITLDLEDNELTSLPPEIGQLNNLTELDLEDNELTSLPPEITQLTNLTTLELGGNELTSLPPEIGQLNNLTSLELYENQLASLPLQIGQLTKLTELHLYENQLTSLPPVIRQLKNLNRIDLTGNPFPIEEIEELLPDARIVFDFRSHARSSASKGKYPAAYQAQKWAVEETPENYRNWYGLSFYALFIDRPGEAITAAQKTLELNPKAKGVETNLALGYLLNDEYEKAEAIYLKWRGKHFPYDKRLCDEVFLKDIADLEAAGVSHPDFEKVKALFEK